MAETDMLSDDKDDILLRNIGQNLKYFRKIFGLTQEQVAEKASISLNFYQQVETMNEKAPSLKTLVRICSALNIPLDYLVKDCGYELFNKYANVKLFETMSTMPKEQFNVFTDTLRAIFEIMINMDIELSDKA